MSEQIHTEFSFKKGSQSKDIIRRFLKNKPAIAGMVILASLLIVFIVGCILIPEETCYQVGSKPFQPLTVSIGLAPTTSVATFLPVLFTLPASP